MAWDAPTEEGFYGPDLPYKGKIKESVFKTDPRYNDGETLLLAWTMETDSDDPEFEEHEITFTVGKNWETNDGGKTAERVDGKAPRINSSTGYGRILDRCVGKLPELKDNFKGALDVLEKRGEPTEANIWLGMEFVFDEESKDFKGEIGVQTRPMPVKFVGVDNGGKVKSKGGSKGGSKGPSKASVRKQLIKLAQENDDYEDFLAEALDVDGIEDHEDLLEQVNDDGDEGFYEQNKE